jgi:hypothetical protein
MDTATLLDTLYKQLPLETVALMKFGTRSRRTSAAAQRSSRTFRAKTGVLKNS